jgi:NADPH2:quinone reductase
MDSEIPTEQWAMVCIENGKLQLKKIPVPVPTTGEVLVKVMAAPLNPSDISMMKGFYTVKDIFRINFPTVSGWEGAGIVVKEGGGYMTKNTKGKRVSFMRKL